MFTELADLITDPVTVVVLSIGVALVIVGVVAALLSRRRRVHVSQVPLPLLVSRAQSASGRELRIAPLEPPAPPLQQPSAHPSRFPHVTIDLRGEEPVIEVRPSGTETVLDLREKVLLPSDPWA
jgi:hypothetical protein